MFARFIERHAAPPHPIGQLPTPRGGFWCARGWYPPAGTSPTSEQRAAGTSPTTTRTRAPRWVPAWLRTSASADPAPWSTSSTHSIPRR